MVNLLIKLIVSAALLILSDLLFAEIYFASFYQVIVIGILLAIVGHTTELFILRRGTLWISTVVDFAVTTLMVYIASQLLPGVRITFIGALYAASFIAIAEYFVHRWLIFTERTKKRA